MDSLRIGVDAHLADRGAGGVQQFVIGLASALSALTDGDEEYFLFTFAGTGWLEPHVSGPCQLVQTINISRGKWKRWLKTAFPAVYKAWQSIPRIGQRSSYVRTSDGTIERCGIQVMHFPHQAGFRTHIPSIYHPWDLQHLHYPEFFTWRNIQSREVMYRVLCEQAALVAVASSWVKHDLLRNYRLSEEKIQVIPVPPVLSAYPPVREHDCEIVRQKHALPNSFIYYPAQTWPHKNHIGLLNALAYLRDQRGLKVPLVSSGYLNEFFPTIRRHVRELNLTDQVQFLGFVSPVELQCLYQLCRCMIFPSKFEGWGLPITEAMVSGVPIACSRVTCLPEQIGDAGLLFDPEDHRAIADAIYKLWTDHSLRLRLIERGKQRVTKYSWDRTARLFRAHYRRIAGRPLTDEDTALLFEQGFV